MGQPRHGWRCVRPGHWTRNGLHCFRVMSRLPEEQWEVWTAESGGSLLAAEKGMWLAIAAAAIAQTAEDGDPQEGSGSDRSGRE